MFIKNTKTEHIFYIADKKHRNYLLKTNDFELVEVKKKKAEGKKDDAK